MGGDAMEAYPEKVADESNDVSANSRRSRIRRRESDHMPSIASEIESEESSSRSLTESSAPTSRHHSSTNALSWIQRRDTHAVNGSKVLMLFVLFVGAVICGILSFRYFISERDYAFFQEFETYSHGALEAFLSEARAQLDGLESLATGISVYAAMENLNHHFQNETLANSTSTPPWPYVSVPHFDIRAMQSNERSLSSWVCMAPLVQGHQRELWEQYVTVERVRQQRSRFRTQQEQRYLNADAFVGESFVVHDDDGAATVSVVDDSSDFSTFDDARNRHRLLDTMERSLATITTTDGVQLISDPSDGPYLPVWQIAPPQPYSRYFNLLSDSHLAKIYNNWLSQGNISVSEAALTGVFTYESFFVPTRESLPGNTEPFSLLLKPIFRDPIASANASYTVNVQEEVVGVVMAMHPWLAFIEGLDYKSHHIFVFTIHDHCGNVTFSYQVAMGKVVFLGNDDFHDSRYDDVFASIEYFAPPFTSRNQTIDFPEISTLSQCYDTIRLYPTQDWEREHYSNKPALYTTVLGLVFFFTTMVFMLYDFLVQQRQKKALETAERQNAIVSSLFPSNVRDRIMKDAEARAQAELLEEQENRRRKRNHKMKAQKRKLEEFLYVEEGEEGKSHLEGKEDDDYYNRNVVIYEEKPIADLFPQATVLFADIVGFTAWSSVREPTQIFELLETLYAAFDEIAKRRRVFKVETVGDCYVAVTGLPDPRKDHAIVMARFAREMMSKMSELAKALEVSLGPDTGDLCLRIGLHSGPVTAGVLRGDKSRFQLFGDTVNTASRMESTGVQRCIQISQETCDLLLGAGKGSWVSPRHDLVQAKGKGQLQTYWLEVKHGSSGTKSVISGNSSHESSSGNEDPSGPMSSSFKFSSTRVTPASKNENAKASVVVEEKEDLAKQPRDTEFQVLSDKMRRLVHWNADVLVRLLKQIVARRNASRKRSQYSLIVDDDHTRNPVNRHNSMGSQDSSVQEYFALRDEEARGDDNAMLTPMEEVREIIELPMFDARAARIQEDPGQIQLPEKVVKQVHEYVGIIATMYQDNPFHNFEHASHVTMSVVKLLSRIVAPDDTIAEQEEKSDSKSGTFDTEESEKQLIQNMHDHTYGITSDPLTQFAVVLSGLIHDVDHPGVPNTQLVKEKTSLASVYSNKSIAEQNSVDISWELLMDPSFVELRSVIYTSRAEKQRFRQLIVNAVMATDIVDKELKELRNARWERAFHPVKEPDAVNEPDLAIENINRKATIVIEHLIQASDVAHTMQHWHVYRKWNERLFGEMYKAYKMGRAEKDPAVFWYKGEIGFFDFYIIPLAKKLKECGVFGVSSAEYLNYAIANRKEWEAKGEDVVSHLIAKHSDEDEANEVNPPVENGTTGESKPQLENGDNNTQPGNKDKKG